MQLLYLLLILPRFWMLSRTVFLNVRWRLSILFWLGFQPVHFMPRSTDLQRLVEITPAPQSN